MTVTNSSKKPSTQRFQGRPLRVTYRQNCNPRGYRRAPVPAEIIEPAEGQAQAIS